jgi:anti-sigma B factor antagonist
MESLMTRFDEADNCWFVSVVGEIDIYNANDLKESLLSLINEKNADVYVDCSELRFIDSTGLGSLVSVLKTVKGYGGSVVLANVRKTIAKLFRITNLDKAFVIAPDEGFANAGVSAGTDTEGE